VRTPIALASASVFALLACSLFGGVVQPSSDSGEGASELRVAAADGGLLALSNGARLTIPAGSLAADVEASLRQVEAVGTTGGAGEFTIPVGRRYEVNLGGQELLGPVRLEIPFDPAALPAGTDASQAFLTYFDEVQGQWVFAGGEPDLARNVIVLEVNHGSSWEPATWNWQAWAAALNGILSANVVSFLEGVAVFVDDCPQEGQSVWVDSTAASGLVQGCVETDDAQAPALRVVNPRAIYVEVEPVSGGSYFDRTLLAPGESLYFRADDGGGVPIVVSADVTQNAGWHLAIHMTIAMLPGFNQLGFQGRTVACITERVRDISQLVSATEALWEGNGAAAAEHIARLYRDEAAMRRFITAADDCGYGPAATWSWPGIRMVGASLATIQSSVEFIPRFLANSHGEVAFRWSSPLSTAPPGPVPTGLTPSAEVPRSLLVGDTFRYEDYGGSDHSLQWAWREQVVREEVVQGHEMWVVQTAGEEVRTNTRFSGFAWIDQETGMVLIREGSSTFATPQIMNFGEGQFYAVNDSVTQTYDPARGTWDHTEAAVDLAGLQHQQHRSLLLGPDVYLLIGDVRAGQLYPLQSGEYGMEILGQETTTVPAGTFVSWSVRSPIDETSYYSVFYDVATGLMVRQELWSEIGGTWQDVYTTVCTIIERSR
jgi:hypothetical protein